MNEILRDPDVERAKRVLKACAGHPWASVRSPRRGLSSKSNLVASWSSDLSSTSSILRLTPRQRAAEPPLEGVSRGKVARNAPTHGDSAVTVPEFRPPDRRGPGFRHSAGRRTTYNPGATNSE